MARLNIKVMLDPWVLPYLRLMDRMGLGDRAIEAVREFVKSHGMRPVP